MYWPYSMMGRIAEFIACVGIKNVAISDKGGLLVALDWTSDDEKEEAEGHDEYE